MLQEKQNKDQVIGLRQYDITIAKPPSCISHFERNQ